MNFRHLLGCDTIGTGLSYLVVALGGGGGEGLGDTTFRGYTCEFYIRGSPSEAKTFTQKYHFIFVRTPKNISKDCRFLKNTARISKYCLHL